MYQSEQHRCNGCSSKRSASPTDSPMRTPMGTPTYPPACPPKVPPTCPPEKPPTGPPPCPPLKKLTGPPPCRPKKTPTGPPPCPSVRTPSGPPPCPSARTPTGPPPCPSVRTQSGPPSYPPVYPPTVPPSYPSVSPPKGPSFCLPPFCQPRESPTLPPEDDSSTTPCTCPPVSPPIRPPTKQECCQPISKVPTCPKNTNVVKPVLKNMQRVINFALEVMFESRRDHYIQMKFVIERSKKCQKVKTFIEARDLAEAYSCKLKPLKRLWEQLWDYYRHLLDQCNNSYNPVPSLTGIDISPVISQASFKKLLVKAVRFSREAANLCNIDYIGNTQFVDWVDGTLRCNPCAIMEICKNGFFENNQSTGDRLIRTFMETQLITNLFIQEWKKGGCKLNQPQAPDIYSTLPTFPGLNDKPKKESAETGIGNVEGLVSLFNTIEVGASTDVDTKKGQRDYMKTSIAAVA